MSSRTWARIVVAASFVAGGATFGQVPNLGAKGGGGANIGGAGGVPNLGNSGGIPNLNRGGVPNLGRQGTVPNLNRQQGVPRINQGTPNRIGNQVPGGTPPNLDTPANRVQSNAANGVGGANSTASRFSAPRSGSPDFNKNLPVRLNAQSIQGLGQQGSLGLNVDTTGRSLKVGKVETGSLAANAGLQANDEIMAVNKSWVNSTEQFRNDLSASLQSQGRAWVMVNRNGEQKWLNMDADGAARSAMGTSYSVENGQLKVTNVFDGFAGASSGLKVGDRIVSINGQKITTRANYLSQISSNAGSDVEIVVDRNGTTETLSGRLPQARQTVADSSEQFRSAVDEMRSLTGELKNSADQSTRPKFDRLEQQIQSLSDQINGTKGNAAGMTEEQSQQIRNSVSEITNSVDGLKGRVSERAAQQLNDLQNRTASLRTMVQNRIDAAKSGAMSRADQAGNAAGSLQSSAINRGSDAKERVSNTNDNAKAIAQRRRQQVKQQTQNLVDRMEGISQKQKGVLAQRFNAVNQRIIALQQQTADAATDGKGISAEVLRGAADQAAAIRSDLEAMRAEGSASAEAELSAAATEAATIQTMYSAMAMAEVSDKSKLADEAQSRATESSKQLLTEINQVKGDTSENVAVQRDAALNEAQQLSQAVSQLKGAQLERVSAIRQQAAAVQARLLIAARSAAGTSRTQFANASGRAAALRGQLNDYAIAANGSANQTRQAVSQQGQQQLQATMTTLQTTVGNVQGRIRQNVEAAQGKIGSAKKMIADARGDAIAAGSDNRAAVLNQLTEARSSLIEAAQQAPADVQSTLIEQIAMVETVQDDLTALIVEQETSVESELRQSSAMGMESDTVAGRVKVNSVQNGSLAARVGLKNGDEVISVNGQNVSTQPELYERLKVASKADQAASIQVRRNGSEQSLTLQAGDAALTQVQ